jgi:uncharacterized repeat protein (TIGR01451 family)
MNKISKKISILFLVLSCAFSGVGVLAQVVGGVAVQTNSATNVYNNQATLNGNLNMPYLGGNNYVYFQWGTGSDFNNQSGQQNLNESGSFSFNITGLANNTTYYFRAVSQGSYGTIYGQNLSFTTSTTGQNQGTYFLATKKAINVTSGNLNWNNYITAKPGDVLSFAVTIYGNTQDLYNVIVRDILPPNLIYMGSYMINTTSYSGNILQGVNIGTVYVNQPIVVSYRVQVAHAGNFAYGATTLTSSALVAPNNIGAQHASAVVVVNKSMVYGASTIETGITDNILANYFFIPLLIMISAIWIYSSGRAYRFADWLKKRAK